MPVLDVALTIYSWVVTRDTYNSEVKTLEVLIDPCFAQREMLGGKELFEAKQLKYDDPRKYIMNTDRNIKVGFVIEDESEMYVIESIQYDRIWMTVLASRRKDLDGPWES